MTPDANPPRFGTGIRGNRWDSLGEQQPAVLPTVSVVVVHFEQQAELDRTLAALSRQTYPRHLVEIIVVDDGSAEAPRVSHGARLLRQDDQGFRLSAARNLGAASATGDILCFLDADTAPEPGYVLALTRLPAIAPETVTVARRRHTRFDDVHADARIEVAAPLAALEEPRWLADAYAASRNLLDADDRSFRFVIGAVIACSRWFFDEVGGFDESFTHYGGEDWEWAHRAWISGAVFAHVPDAVAWHDGPDWAGRSDDAGGDAAGGADAAGADATGNGAGADVQENLRRRRKNGETLHLAQTIAVRQSSPRAVLIARVDVVVTVTAALSDAALFVCADSILSAVPHARIVVPDPAPEILRGDPRVVSSTRSAAEATDAARVRIDIQNAVRVRTPDAPGDSRLAWAVETVGVGTLGEVVFTDAHGTWLLTVSSRRAALRRARWSDATLFDTLVEEAPWLAPITSEPSVAAYLGGWD
ncbi:glycosyltransferase family 2 protein [Agreia sp.]|uniref:glycosyltransferase family 2 protein n=1 Tax=Agreia sp. TaxID=1872416 RepID=UPI0035BC815E